MAGMVQGLATQFNAILDVDKFDAAARHKLAQKIARIPGVLRVACLKPAPGVDWRNLSIIVRSTGGLHLAGRLPVDMRTAKSILALDGVTSLRARFDAVCNDNADRNDIARRIKAVAGVEGLGLKDGNLMTVLYDVTQGQAVEDKVRKLRGVKKTQRIDMPVMFRR